MLDLETLPRFKKFSFEIINLIPEWAKAYEVETVAIMRQIPIAHAWCNANPKKAPKRDPVRFLHNWMRLAKKMGNLVTAQPNRLFREQAPEDEVMTGEDFAKMRKTVFNRVP